MSLPNIGGGRVLQVCDTCGGVDDHPRHHFGGGVADEWPPPTPEIIRKVTAAAPEDQVDRLLAELIDTGTTSRHRDCCREAGCPTGECVVITAGVEDLRGADLLDHLVSLQEDNR